VHARQFRFNLMATDISETCLSTATDTLRVVRISDAQHLQSYADRWDALAGEIPFRSWLWCDCWWRHYADARSRLLVLLVLDEHDELIGVAPWYLQSSGRDGRVVRFLGSGEVCSDYVTLLSQPAMAEAVGRRIGQWLASEASSEWDLLDLTGVEQDDPAIVALTGQLAKQGHVVDSQADLSCWRTELSPTWDEFLASLSKSRRERTRAMLRRTIDTGRAVVHQVTTEQELDQAFPILIDLHQKRRRSLSQPGCFASPRFTSFHTEVARLLLAAGRLRLFWTELEGRPLSVEYSLVGGDTIYYYQGGFEPELGDERPGWLSFAVSLKLAIAEGYHSFDFLRGDESYKASWRATARPLIRVRVVGRQATARVRFATRRACEEVKGWARQLLSRTKGT
jgi:CelD/BcsL family acetyltransferase involved in cellulose biosynthesis